MSSILSKLFSKKLIDDGNLDKLTQQSKYSLFILFWSIVSVLGLEDKLVQQNSSK